MFVAALAVALSAPPTLPADLPRGERATVVVFLSFDCPVSLSYSADLTALATATADRGAKFVGVVPG